MILTLGQISTCAGAHAVDRIDTRAIDRQPSARRVVTGRAARGGTAEPVPTGPLFRGRPARCAAWRRLPARLRLPGRGDRGLPVVLELYPWADRRTEPAISPTARPTPGGAGGVVLPGPRHGRSGSAPKF
jgi:hypothetical protein